MGATTLRVVAVRDEDAVSRRHSWSRTPVRNGQLSRDPSSCNVDPTWSPWPGKHRVSCIECGRRPLPGKRWSLRLTDDDEVVVYCPECDKREFGGAGARPTN